MSAGRGTGYYGRRKQLIIDYYLYIIYKKDGTGIASLNFSHVGVMTNMRIAGVKCEWRWPVHDPVPWAGATVKACFLGRRVPTPRGASVQHRNATVPAPSWTLQTWTSVHTRSAASSPRTHRPLLPHLSAILLPHHPYHPTQHPQTPSSAKSLTKQRRNKQEMEAVNTSSMPASFRRLLGSCHRLCYRS